MRESQESRVWLLLLVQAKCLCPHVDISLDLSYTEICVGDMLCIMSDMWLFKSIHCSTLLRTWLGTLEVTRGSQTPRQNADQPGDHWTPCSSNAFIVSLSIYLSIYTYSLFVFSEVWRGFRGTKLTSKETSTNCHIFAQCPGRQLRDV